MPRTHGTRRCGGFALILDLSVMQPSFSCLSFLCQLCAHARHTFASATCAVVQEHSELLLQLCCSRFVVSHARNTGQLAKGLNSMKRPSIDGDDPTDEGPPRAATPNPTSNPTSPGEIKLHAPGAPQSPSEPMSPSEAFKRPRLAAEARQPIQTKAREPRPLWRDTAQESDAPPMPPRRRPEPRPRAGSAESPSLPPARPLGTDAGSPTLSRRAAPAPSAAPATADPAEESEAPTPDVPPSRPLGTGPESPQLPRK